MESQKIAWKKKAGMGPHEKLISNSGKQTSASMRPWASQAKTPSSIQHIV